MHLLGLLSSQCCDACCALQAHHAKQLQYGVFAHAKHMQKKIQSRQMLLMVVAGHQHGSCHGSRCGWQY
jgi:hypothetical protein